MHTSKQADTYQLGFSRRDQDTVGCGAKVEETHEKYATLDISILEKFLKYNRTRQLEAHLYKSKNITIQIEKLG